MAEITEFPFVEQIEDEAMALLYEARSVLTREATLPDAEFDLAERWLAVHKNFEVTARLSWVMAWVNYQKAARAGELTHAEARAGLPALELPNDTIPSDEVALPEALQNRLDRSRALYDRAVGFRSKRD